MLLPRPKRARSGICALRRVWNAAASTPYGSVTADGDVDQSPRGPRGGLDTSQDGRWTRRDEFPEAYYVFCLDSPTSIIDILGLKSRPAGRNWQSPSQMPRTTFRGTPKRTEYQYANNNDKAKAISDAVERVSESVTSSLGDFFLNLLFDKDKIDQIVGPVAVITTIMKQKQEALEECKKQREQLIQQGLSDCNKKGCCVMTAMIMGQPGYIQGLLAVYYKYSQTPCSKKPAGEPVIYDPKTPLF